MKNKIIISHEIFLMMSVAIHASKILSGTAYNNIPYGKTIKLPIVTHIITNPVNQERKVVCDTLNFLETIKISIANKKDQIPQTAPFTGFAGKLRPRFW